MSIVSNAEELLQALAAASPGDVIQLAPGDYGDVTIQYANFASDVTITSLDPSAPATFSSLTLKDSSHLHFDNIAVHHVLEAGEPDWAPAVRADRCSDITISNSEISGSADGNYANDGVGFVAADCENLVLQGNDFHDLTTGLGISGSEYIQVLDNDFHDIRSDGADFGAVSHVVVEGNTFTDFHPLPDDHPDMIQFWNNEATEDMTDVVIRNNTLSKGSGDNVQGIFIQGRVQGDGPDAAFGASGFVIEGNSIEVGAAQGIWVYDVDGLTITGNTITEAAGADLMPGIELFRTTDAVVTNNTTPSIGETGTTGTVLENNTITSTPPGGLPGDNTAGSEADDVIDGTSGNDVLEGAGGNDTMSGLDGNDLLIGGAGNDTLLGGDGNDGFFGGGGNDIIYGGNGDDGVFGDGGDDLIVGEGGNDTLYGGDGNDGFYGGGGNDFISGDAGDDAMFGDGGADQLFGGAGRDQLFGGDDDDLAYGGDDNDVIYGGNGDDTAYGDAGDDLLVGEAGSDTLFGGDGNDGFYGGGGNDLVFGGAGNDGLIGDGGNDRLDGGSGNDWLQGGADADVFVFSDDALGVGNDTIADFASGSDLIDLSGLSSITAFGDLTITGNGTSSVAVSFFDGVADVSLSVQSASALWLTESDFIL